MRRIIIIVCTLFLLCGCVSSTRPAAPVSAQEIQVRLDLAESYLTGGKPRLALQELTRLQGAADRVPRYGFDLGLAYLAVGEAALAVKAMEQAVALDPDYGEAWNNLGRIRELLGDRKGAEEAYERALSILTYRTPEFAAYNLAELCRDQGRIERAEEYGRIAVSKNWRYTPAYLLLAGLDLGRDDPRGAQEWLEKGAAANMADPELLLALGENLVRLDRIDAARKQFHRIVKDHPDSQQAGTALEYLQVLQ
jgi:Tfp pilus assembly protein PilF